VLDAILLAPAHEYTTGEFRSVVGPNSVRVTPKGGSLIEDARHVGAANVESTAISTDSWLKSSVTVRHFKRRSFIRLSDTKSMLHTWLADSAARSGCRPPIGRLAFLRLRTVNPASV